MNFEEFYKAVGGDYREVIGRLLKEDRLVKYIKKFSESDDFSELQRTLNEKKYDEAFRHVHNIKGLSLNMGFTALVTSSSILCELLRHGDPGRDVSKEVEMVGNDYYKVMSEISRLFG